jgi:hypothetical protein
VLDADVLTLDPSEVAETEPECLVPKRGIGRRYLREQAYPADCCRRLRASREWRGKNNEAPDESAAVHLADHLIRARERRLRISMPSTSPALIRNCLRRARLITPQLKSAGKSNVECPLRVEAV